MNQIIHEMRNREGPHMEAHRIPIICYADNSVLIGDNERRLQRKVKFHYMGVEITNRNKTVDTTR